ncbi:glycosyltransferase [Novosphingobium sp. PC22D]|uniref:glycosyltransferase n=1 Tax=Novosphingobium sp. PC22D TaxID=1962403 RepID=UPI00143B30B3|nr:glycosyltransferase [Novosphingobium sp. PC22D]
MSAAKPAIQMIWTRPVDEQPQAGRLRIAASIRDALREGAEVNEIVISTAMELYGRAWPFAVGWSWLKALLRGEMLPVQCALFATGRQVREVCERLDTGAEAIYLDGVRSLAVLEAVRNRNPTAHIVVDLDDLMSRRMRLLRALGETLSPGYLISRLSPTVVRLLSGTLGTLLVRYEEQTLRGAEARVCELADAIVLLSDADMKELEPSGCARRLRIAPSHSTLGNGLPARLEGALRFVFIGSDQLTQNRLSIDYLRELWRKYEIPTPLVIYGIQRRQVELPPNVRYGGYVADLQEVYDGESILLAPSFLRGGIKTKVLEAFAYGAPVIGNSASFEGLDNFDYPLTVDDEAQLVALLVAPEAFRARLIEAARCGLDRIRKAHSPETFTRTWLEAMGIAPVGLPCVHAQRGVEVG